MSEPLFRSLDSAAIANDIRNRTQEVLRNPAWHEGARH